MKKSQIWLVGGTTESFQLSRQIIRVALLCVVSVTTNEASQRYPTSLGLTVQVQRFSDETLLEFLQIHNISVIVDASHPHAAEISERAIASATALQIPYLRFERPLVTDTGSDQVQVVESIESVLTDEYLYNQRVLLTVGVKALHQFQPWQHRSTLFARILPSQAALQQAISAGFSPSRLMALRPPISLALEMALWQQWQIERVITKASGQAGGEATKRQVAESLGVPLVVIKRPQVSYPQQTSEITDAIAFCQQAIKRADQNFCSDG